MAGCSKQGPDANTLMKDAQDARSKGEYKTAIIHLRNATQQAPNDAESHFLLGLVYNESDDPRAAEKEFRRAIDLKKDVSTVRPHLVKALLLQSEFKKVLDETRRGSQSDVALTPDLLSLRGIAQLSLGAVEDAKASFEQALAAAPDFPDALLGQARLAVVTGDTQGAARLIDRALEKSPKHLDALLVKGDLKRLLNDNDAAIAAYQKVAEYYPENIRARLNMASVYLALSKYDDALRQVDVVRKISPESPMADYLQALAEYKRQEYGKAKASVGRVLSVTSDHVPTRLLAGAIEYAQGNYTQAEPHLKYVLDRAPNNLHARKLLATSYLRNRQMARAIEVLLPGLEQAPDDIALLAMAGDAYLQNGDFSKASTYYEKAAQIDPKNAKMRAGLGLSRLAAGEDERALGDLMAAAGLDVGNYQADVLRVTAALASNDYDKAEHALRDVEAKQPNNPLTYNLKAAILAGKKRYSDARAALEKAISLQPTFFPAIANLAQLDLQDKNPQAARKRIEALLQKEPNNVQALLLIASLGPRIGAKSEETVDWLMRAKRVNSGAIKPTLMLARHYLTSGDARKAVDFAKEAQAASPDNAEVTEVLGDAQMALGERNAAVTSFSKLTALQPKSPIALVKLAEAQIANDNAPGAAFSLKKALALNPRLVEAQTVLAMVEARAGRINEAMRIVAQVQSQAPKSAEGIVLEGDVRMVEKKYTQAVASYEKALAISNNGPLLIKLHGALMQLGRSDEAYAKLLAWIKNNPDDLSVRYYLGDFSLKSKKPQIAIEQYEWIAARDPQNISVLNNLAWACHDAKDSRALSAAERAYTLAGDNPFIMDTYGWMQINYGRIEKGVDLLQRAASLAPDQQEIRYHYAVGLAKSGKEDSARAELERILGSGGKFPQQAEAVELLKQLKN